MDEKKVNNGQEEENRLTSTLIVDARVTTPVRSPAISLIASQDLQFAQMMM
jgi:hypothetical protein